MIYRVPNRCKLDKSLWIKRELANAKRGNSVNTRCNDRSFSFPINEDRRTTAKACVYTYLSSLEICLKKYTVTEECEMIRIRILTITKNICMLC